MQNNIKTDQMFTMRENKSYLWHTSRNYLIESELNQIITNYLGRDNSQYWRFFFIYRIEVAATFIIVLLFITEVCVIL